MNSKNVESDLDEVLKTKNRVFVLFYASWCPFSRKFLPIYEKCTMNSPTPCLRLMVDDRADLCERYAIEVFPTVLFFENGKVSARLDGEPSEGLNEKQLKNMLGSR
jgi:thioredoxin 1